MDTGSSQMEGGLRSDGSRRDGESIGLVSGKDIHLIWRCVVTEIKRGSEGTDVGKEETGRKIKRSSLHPPHREFGKGQTRIASIS